jgi:hypothetical protein
MLNDGVAEVVTAVVTAVVAAAHAAHIGLYKTELCESRSRSCFKKDDIFRSFGGPSLPYFQWQWWPKLHQIRVQVKLSVQHVQP